MRASQYTGLGIRTIMGNLVYPQVSPGITVSAAGVSVGGAVGSTAVSSTNAVWSVPAVSFVQGTASNYSVLATGPGNYTAGGVYDVDVSGSPLSNPPFQLSEAGALAYDGSGGATTVGGVVFGYTEPGALPTLTLHPTQSGTYPYMAAAYPVEGAVPFGMEVVSPDDSTLRSSILSRWPDNSAQVVVVAGRYVFSDASTRTVRLRAGTVSNTPLTTARIGQLVSDVTVNFTGTPQVLSTWASPDRVWWANAQVICARYRVSCGLGAMEAVVDIHAFAAPENRAFVEVVIENGKMDCNAAAPLRPSNQTYTNATVSVNGTTIATVSSPTAGMVGPNQRGHVGGFTYSGTHEAFRAWYCSAQVDGGAVTALATAVQQTSLFGIQVTHDTASMRAHPWFFRPLDEPTINYQTRYTETWNGLPKDTYVPWATCRLRVPGMDLGSDDEQIAMFTMEQSDYIVSGDKFARSAVIATGLAQHSLNYNWRHSGIGEYNNQVPARSQLINKTSRDGGSGTWPHTSPSGPKSEPLYGGSNLFDGTHIPATGLVAFMCRPSPCFIELAQKEFAWNHTNYGSNDGSHDNNDGPRSMAWRSRNYAIAIFLTPDVDVTRKQGMRDCLDLKRASIDKFFDMPYNTLQSLYGYSYDNAGGWNTSYTFGGFPWVNTGEFWQWFSCFVFPAVSYVKVLRGAQGIAWDAMTIKRLAMPVRRVLEATGAEWRTVSDNGFLGRYIAGSPPSIDMGNGNYGEQIRATLTGSVPASSGVFLFREGSDTDWSQVSAEAYTGYSYSLQYFSALCAAVEYGVPNADAAWTKLYGTSGDGGITNFASFRASTQGNTRFSRFPRNK